MHVFPAKGAALLALLPRLHGLQQQQRCRTPDGDDEGQRHDTALLWICKIPDGDDEGQRHDTALLWICKIPHGDDEGQRHDTALL